MRIPFEEVTETLKEKLIKYGSPEDYAGQVAYVMAENSLEGVYTHGINRYMRLINNIRDGLTMPKEIAGNIAGLGGYEIWDGKLGFGIVNAQLCTNRAIELARTHGIACVSLRNTSHWLRGGTYGKMTAEAGMLGIHFTNARTNMCAWGTQQHCLGNNPLVLAVPRANGDHVIADTSFSQYSYGKLQLARLEGRMMPQPGGYDENGQLSCDPAVILKSQKILPMGEHKGASIAMLLDLITAVSSFGNCASMVAKLPGNDEHSFSQTFIVINPLALGDQETFSAIVENAVNCVLNAKPLPGGTVHYPGQSMKRYRTENLEQGIPVNEGVWTDICAL